MAGIWEVWGTSQGQCPTPHPSLTHWSRSVCVCVRVCGWVGDAEIIQSDIILSSCCLALLPASLPSFLSCVVLFPTGMCGANHQAPPPAQPPPCLLAVSRWGSTADIVSQSWLHGSAKRPLLTLQLSTLTYNYFLLLQLSLLWLLLFVQMLVPSTLSTNLDKSAVPPPPIFELLSSSSSPSSSNSREK